MWYVIQVYTGRELEIAQQCRDRVTEDGEDVFVPLAERWTKIHGETGLREYRKELAKLRLDASLQVLVIKMLANPPKEPRMTKLAPVMNALFPSVTDAVRKSALESSDASEWNQSAEDALCTLGVIRIDDLVRRDIIQCAMTYYFLIELNDESKLQEWTARGGLK